ncbi:MAG: trigger factor [Dehalococcoidia bacterium]|nr:trigger factor [Dehalococcoidia bacterium]
MKVTSEKTENRQAFLKIEAEPAEIEAQTDITFRRLVKQVDVPGFRRGKAPRPIFERHFGRERLFHEMLDDYIPVALKQAVDEQKLEPISRPEVEVVTENPVVLKAVIPLKPEVTLGDYKTIDLKPRQVDITEEMVDQVVERLRHQHATWEPVDRAVAIGDRVNMDLESTAKGEQFINRKGLEYQLLDADTGPVPGFAGELVGMKKGEEKEFTHKFPDDYFRKELAGADATFKVKINEIKQEVLSEVNDQFALQVGKDYTTVELLRQKIRDEIKERQEHEAEHEFEDQVIEAAAAMSQVDYPPVLEEAEIDHLLERNFRYIQQTGQTIENYLQTIGKTVEQMREELRPTAKKRVAEALVLGKIASEEKVEVTPAEIDAEIEELVKNSQGDKEELRRAFNSEQNRESIENTLVTRKVIKRLTEVAQSPKEQKGTT